jgi:hypothetical protein
MESRTMSKFRFLFSALAISISVLVVEPFSNLDSAFAQSLEEAAQLTQKALQLLKQGHSIQTLRGGGSISG